MAFIIKDRINDTIIASGDEEDGTVRILEDCWYYSPIVVDTTHLVVTDRVYTCPYKGVCHWVDLDAPNNKAKNVAFIYDSPKTGYEGIKGRIAFYGRDTSGTIAINDEDEAPV